MAITASPNIRFYFLQRCSWMTQRKFLKQFIAEIFKLAKRPLKELTIIFCSDEYLLEINQKYLRHETYTDVVTFDLSGQGQGIVGEIYISVDRVKENSLIFDVSCSEELHRVIFHGILHLLGYNDHTPSQKRQIRKKEDFYLQKYRRLLSFRST